ncbi:MAG: hypothetical protein ACE37F_26425 [Nannocystaceae bacterium]|nr:hypothetical protein [bacterium]
MNERALQAQLTEAERAQLAAGFHEKVAEALCGRERPDLAGVVLEQIWAWDGALAAYRDADLKLDALRIALDSGTPAHLDAVLSDIEEDAVADELEHAIALLQARRRPMEAARLLELRDDPSAQARALERGGDALGAARALAEAGEVKEALDLITHHELHSHAALALAATLAWELGDAEGSARHAQAALRLQEDDDETRDQLGRALTALGHDLAAQMVLRDQPAQNVDAVSPGRYRVTGLGGTGIVGGTYLALDRATHEEVELHLLLAEHADARELDADVAVQLDRFAAVAQAAAGLGHPAIRPILRLDPRAGLLVMPRTEGTSLRALLRPPGMRRVRSRARAWIAFLLEGLMAGHARGLVHGWLLPSLITFDNAGRPLVPPFGGHYLSGLTATHTGGLEELMAVTAPELREGAAPTAYSDLFAVGVLLQWLLDGELRAAPPEDPTPEDRIARALQSPDPEDRPRAEDALRVLRRQVADVHELGGASSSMTAGQASDPGESPSALLATGIVVDAAESWTDAELDALSQHVFPWLQPILDREGRRFTLAPWPEGCAALREDVTSFETLLDARALALSTPGLEAAIRDRLRPQSLVRTPSGAWMLALDDLIAR